MTRAHRFPRLTAAGWACFLMAAALVTLHEARPLPRACVDGPDRWGWLVFLGAALLLFLPKLTAPLVAKLFDVLIAWRTGRTPSPPDGPPPA